VPQQLPYDRPAPTIATGIGAVHHIVVGDDMLDRLRQLATDRGTTERAIVLAAYHVLQHTTSRVERTFVLEPMANRSVSTGRLVGCCTNPVVRSASFSQATTFSTMIRALDAEFDGAAAHTRFPYGRLLHALRPSATDQTLTEAGFAWQKTSRLVDEHLTTALALAEPGVTTTVGELEIGSYPMPIRSSPMPLNLLAIAGRDKLHLALEYQLDRFDLASIELLAERFELILAAIVDDPDIEVLDFDATTKRERSRRLAQWNRTESGSVPGASALDLVERQVVRFPQSPAVTDVSMTLTYRELDEWANRLSHYIMDRGVGPGDQEQDAVFASRAVYFDGTIGYE
jgi:non-ribosomal peptide synthetase component F